MAVCLLHFLLVVLVNSRQAFSDLGNGETILPQSCRTPFRYAATAVSTVIGERLSLRNPLRRGIVTYEHITGIETGYGFFAPNVSISHKLVFEVRYADGRVEYELPRVAGEATGTRLPLLLDNIARARYDLLRETMLKMMAFEIWEQHPDAAVIRAVFGFVNLPSISDFERGEKESYQFLFAYDFRFGPPDEPARH
jgi:hypothetical protein